MTLSESAKKREGETITELRWRGCVFSRPPACRRTRNLARLCRVIHATSYLWGNREGTSIYGDYSSTPFKGEQRGLGFLKLEFALRGCF